MPEHVSKLPSDIIDGVLGNGYFVGSIPQVTNYKYIEEENKHGIPQLAYTAQTASLAPINFNGGGRGQTLYRIYDKISFEAKEGNPIGVFGAGWDDAVPHSELYWLGWSTVAQYGWSTAIPNVEQHVGEFIDYFYGPQGTNIINIYQEMDKQARFYSRSWDRVITSVPGTGTYRGSYSNSVGKFDAHRPPSQSTLPQPALPFSPGMDFTPVYSTGRYKSLSDEARELEKEITRVIYQIDENLLRTENNHYNLEVLRALSKFMRHHDRLLMGMSDIESSM